MKIRRIKVWLSRGWFHVVSLTSILMLLCIPSKAQQNNMDSLLRRLEEFSKETGVKVERIEKGHDYVDLGPSDSKVSLTGLSADMIAKVKAYTPDPGELEEYEYIIEIKPSSDDVNTDSKDNKLFQVPEGITLKELLARLPGVEKDKDCSFITESGKDIVTSIEFNGGKVYPENTTSGYPDDYKLNSGAIHVVIMDRKHFRKYLSKTDRNDLPKNRAEISISHYPRQNADDLLYILLRGRREM